MLRVLDLYYKLVILELELQKYRSVQGWVDVRNLMKRAWYLGTSPVTRVVGVCFCSLRSIAHRKHTNTRDTC